MSYYHRTLAPLDILYQKYLRYQHHHENYLQSMQYNIIPSGLQLKIKLSFNAVSDNFNEKLKTVIFDAEKKLVKLLLIESEKVTSELEIETNQKIKEDDKRT